MVPKRFKAVCTETGKPFRLDQNFKTHENFYKISLNPLSNQAICQSTGLTDSRGQEVYEGDVLFMIVDDDLMLFCVERSGSNTCIELCPMDGDYRFIEPIDNYVEDNSIDHVVIGNRWMPQAELQARAEAVSNEL